LAREILAPNYANLKIQLFQAILFLTNFFSK